MSNDVLKKILAQEKVMQSEARKFAEITGVIEPEKSESIGDKSDSPVLTIAQAIDETKELFKKFIVLPNESIATFAAFWLAGTYCFRLFSYYGYLALRSATPRCGKSKFLKLVSNLAVECPPVSAFPTAAALYRSNRSVTILDEVDRLRNNDKELFGQVLAILNFGFEADGVVDRVEKTKERFVTKSFPVYGPKALAGIEALADTLGDRAFHVQMKRSNRRTPRLNKKKLTETFLNIRASFQYFADEYDTTIETAYLSLPDETPHLSEFDDRFQDISEPLLVLAAVVDSISQRQFSKELIEGLKITASRRSESGREASFKSFLEVAKARLGNRESVFVPTIDFINEFRENDSLNWVESGKALSSFLRNFDLTPESNGNLRGYQISREWLQEWGGRYV